MAALSPAYMVDRTTDEIFRSCEGRVTATEARGIADRIVTELFLQDGSHEMTDKARSCIREIRALTLRGKAHSSLQPPLGRQEVIDVLDKWGFR